MNEYLGGATSVVETVFLQSSASTTGAGLGSLVYNSSGLTCYYVTSTGTASVAVTLATISTLGTYTSGGFAAIDNTNMPGLYEFHPPNAAFASGPKWVAFYFQGATNLVPRVLKYRLEAVNPDSAATFMTGVNGVAPPTNWNLMVIDGSGRIDLGKILGTASAATAGYVAPDWGHVNAPTTTVNLSGTTIATSQVVASVSGNVTGSVGSISGVTFPTNFGSENIDSSGRVLLQPTQTGVTIPTVTTVGSVSGSVASVSGNVTGSVGSISGVTFPTNFGSENIDSSGRVLLQPTQTGVTIPTVTAVTNAVTTTFAVKKNTAFNNFEFPMNSSTSPYGPLTGLGTSITGTVSIDGGAFGALTNGSSEISGGMYKINLAAADLNGNCITLQFNGTGALETLITIITQS